VLSKVTAALPNKRVQRTRLRSPLTRHPLGRQGIRCLPDCRERLIGRIVERMNDARDALSLRRCILWAVLFAAAVLCRTALDWLRPLADFHNRASVSTAIGIAILFLAAFGESFRTKSLRSGVIAALAVTAFAAPLEIFGAGALLAVRHDAATMAAIQGSGGLGEVFTMPLLLLAPGLVLGGIGGLAGWSAKSLRTA
jgi:hypothetical protein